MPTLSSTATMSSSRPVAVGDDIATHTTLLGLERRGWEALATSGEAAVAHFDRVLAPSVLFVLPGDLIIVDRDAALRSMAGPPWDEVDLAEERILGLGDGSAVVAYRARAWRGAEPYEALVTSTYRRLDDGWRLTAHQQTPVMTA